LARYDPGAVLDLARSLTNDNEFNDITQPLEVDAADVPIAE
jgi:hypothetical protein